MSKAQEQSLIAVARAICQACDENPDHSGDAQGNDFRWKDYLAVAQAAIDAMPASGEQQAAQQDAERWRAFSQGAVFPKLAFNNGNSHWQYGELRGLSANAVADLLIAARASNGGKEND